MGVQASVTTTVEWVEVRGVTRLYGSTPALRGVDARFEGGRITFLEGANGAGKSTLVGVIGTVLKPSRGTVWYEPIGGDRERVRSQIGWVAHESHCYRDLTARQNVELAARLYGAEPGRAWDLVSRRVGAGALADKRVGALSKGQRQRVALARALVHDPSVLLLDEPWAGLDAAGAKGLEQVLAEERDRGRVVIVVSHCAECVRRLGGSTVRLERGRVVSALSS
ncbi:MAG: ABC transporter ATP-binding protein [Polyangiaceae bacterium]|nr:ABC transporter ATP-binding protein [Polyangiaceae bacterium]